MKRTIWTDVNRLKQRLTIGWHSVTWL